MRPFALLLFACLAAQAAPPPLEWDLADHGGEIAASGAGLRRASVFGPPWQAARSRMSQSEGIRTVQFAIDGIGDGQVMVGVANGKASIAASLGSDTNSVGYWSNGNTYFDESMTPAQPGPFTAGDVVGLQADFAARTVRFRKNASEWSAAVSISSLGPDVYVGAAVYAGSQGGQSLRIVSDDWNDFHEPTINIVVAGDSISLTGGVLRTYVPRLADEFARRRAGWARVQHFAMNGASWDFAWDSSGYPYSLLQDFPRRVAPAMSATLPNWLVMFAGTNGIAVAQHDAAYEYTKLQTYASVAIAAGFPPDHIIVPTMLPRAGLPETARSAYNAAIVADPGRLGYRVARLDLDGRIGAPGAQANAAFFSDGIHPTDAGHEIIKDIIYAAFPQSSTRFAVSRALGAR